jgi:hypothetical protein
MAAANSIRTMLENRRRFVRAIIGICEYPPRQQAEIQVESWPKLNHSTAGVGAAGVWKARATGSGLRVSFQCANLCTLCGH